MTDRLGKTEAIPMTCQSPADFYNLSAFSAGPRCIFNAPARLVFVHKGTEALIDSQYL